MNHTITLASRTRRVLLVLITLVIATLQTSAAFAQPANANAVLERLSGLGGIERANATIDAELAQRHNRRGNTYNNLERFDEAIAEYKLSIAANPNHTDSLRNLANIYYYQQNYEEVIPLLARFIRLEVAPTTPLIAAQHTLGQLLRDARRFDEAIEIDLRAIATEPHNDSQVYVMGNTYLNAGRTDLAIRVYESAVNILVGNAFLHRTLGRMYEMESRLDDALTHYRKAAELDTGSQFYKDLVTATEARLSR